MRSNTVFMFHAIGSESKLKGCDPHYAYDIERFTLLLKSIKTVQSLENSLNQASNNPIFTFDDGHISNYQAAELIKEFNGGSADFFINPNTVGTDNYLNWMQIRKMKDLGMSIQSHSLDHIYLSDLTYSKQKQQLETSKKQIEDNLGSEVTVLAPPGGRFNKDTVELCHYLGYKHLSVSKPGRWNGGYISPRIPVLKSTSLNDLVECSLESTAFIRKQVMKYQVTGIAKKLLGNRSYDFIRSKILGEVA